MNCLCVLSLIKNKLMKLIENIGNRTNISKRIYILRWGNETTSV
jgi:hypothetical protein